MPALKDAELVEQSQAMSLPSAIDVTAAYAQGDERIEEASTGASMISSPHLKTANEVTIPSCPARKSVLPEIGDPPTIWSTSRARIC